MDYNLGGTSPDPYGGGGGSIHLVCDHCSTSDNYNTDDADDGQFTCRTCSAVHTTQATAADPHDLPVTGNISVRRVATQPTPKLGARTPAPYPRTPQVAPVPAAAAFDDFMELSEPRDFAPGSGTWGEPEDLAVRVRWRYVRGLQVILQRQLEVLVERHQVGAFVCAVAGIVWVQLVAASRVFDGIWARQVLEDHKAAGRKNCSGSGDNKKPDEVKYESDDEMLLQRKDRRKVEFAFLRSLRMVLPVYSTLAVCFLACHIARETILPSDIYRWAMEGNIPYVAAFTEVDRFLGSSFQDCPLDGRQLFRPVRVIGAWQLEAAAGSIAQKVGLRLPSVNFYAIAQRCLKDLLLPIDRILPHACRIYEWAMPAELWLSSNPARVPTRVCVMAILIVALRLLYNINGQGIWEICEEGRNPSESHHDTNSSTSRKLEVSNSEEFGTRELLCAIAAAYDKINTTHDYSCDLRSYLKYCKEVIFTGITFSDEENHLIEIFWDMYKAREDDNPKAHVKSQSHSVEDIPITNGVKKCYRDGAFVEASSFSASSGHDAMQMLKSEMQDHGFRYLPPRKPRKSDGYLRYRRKRLSGGFIYVAHADYYMLLRAFAKLAEIDIRIMHISVLKLERRLACIEERIERSLNTLQNFSTGTGDELRSVSD
ncbi:TATA box-binding protein-associated factor RNA polymerase I subunit B-like isoform X2 [Miscanthus floridulus]|uniref:TATA box-binding protein-associated factor RNA polymerase I subunit B-like isoform X2 n=1 Tax=Miscanthus floridulus TaxID=154761 RepID=UPI00345A7686